MRRIHSRVAIAVTIGALLFCRTARANQHLRVPEDVDPDFYMSVPLEALHDEEWAAIPFFRPPECIRPNFNLLRYFDAAAVKCPLLVDGFAEFNDVGPILSEIRGLGAVPIWLVRWPELQAATADGVVTIGELAELPSLQVGFAEMYNEQNHIFRIHQVSHFALVARGALQDGRSFDLVIVEVDLVLVRVLIRFES